MSHRAVHIVHPRLTDLREQMCTRLLFEENPTAKPVWGRKNEVPISHEKEKPSKKQQILSQTHNRIRAKVKNLSFVRVNLHNFTSSQVCILAHLGSLTLLSSACIKRPKVSASIGFSSEMSLQSLPSLRLLATFGRQGMVRGAHHSVDVQFALGLSNAKLLGK